jgi:hypothetical protein
MRSGSFTTKKSRVRYPPRGSGLSLLIIFLPILGMLGDPFGCSFFGSETLDYFRSSMNTMEPKAGANSSPKQAGTTTPPQPTSKASTSETPKR